MRPVTPKPDSPRCRRLIWSIPKPSPATIRSSTRLCATRSIRACSRDRAPRLHLKIAEEIERRRGNRLAEVVETLAHHYSQTDRADKAFTYLAMAARRALASIPSMRPTLIS